MTGLEDEDVPSPNPPSLLQRSRSIAWTTLQIASPVFSLGCAVLIGYFTYSAATRPPPEDMSSLAISILKSGEASPEMRAWATGVLGLRAELSMPVRLTPK